MMDLPELSEAGSEAVEKAKTLCPWLPDPFTCPECQTYCDATIAYDPHMCQYTDAWRCPDCGNEYYREGY